eukprot:TRINITY_DN4618_c2_g1_i2.p1 TRINITY_DN4618_c2_g1~~TRINITY_DN4618_c2_g1_i2.p1  ORF type:complete len:500 (-),score=138.89 TRINITY_DN4618_c2_g1_i2:344-1843(-)
MASLLGGCASNVISTALLDTLDSGLKSQGVDSHMACLSYGICISSSRGEHFGTSIQSLSSHSGSLASRDARSAVVPVQARIKKTKRAPMDPDYPWPDKYKAEEKGFLAFLSMPFFKSPAKASLLRLPFERPVAEVEKKIEEVRELAKKTGMDFTEQIEQLEEKYSQLRKDIYLRLTPVQRLSVARHPNRPTFLDHVHNITEKWVELHGDRAGHDDPALVCGLGRINGMSCMLMGHQKGRNTKENIYRNFGMPAPSGYRKALRLMRHADKFGFPIITFIDTPGAYAGVEAEETGQGEAIAMNLREMFGLRVPTISIVIGEGGSGGALAIGCCNRMLMLENSVYYVASPEACAAILWKTASAAPKATEALRITATELQALNVVDDVIQEPLGGAHADPLRTSLYIKDAVTKHLLELLKLDEEELLQQRVAKFRNIGGVEEKAQDPHKKRNMKASDCKKPLMVPFAATLLNNGNARRGTTKVVKAEVNSIPGGFLNKLMDKE